jgi:uncharacterized membrane protein (Fun14 family)
MECSWGVGQIMGFAAGYDERGAGKPVSGLADGRFQ